jgi:hypothetical protein
MSDNVPQPEGSRLDWFKGTIKLFESVSEAKRREVTVAAFGLWSGYPMFREAIEWFHHATDEEKHDLREDLKRAHFLATHQLMLEVERVGLNPAPLYEARRVCLELFRSVRRNGPAQGPFGIVWFHHPDSIDDIWPDCLGPWRYSLPPAMQDAIRQGEEIIQRLNIRLSQDEGKIPCATPFDALRLFARNTLRGQERAAIEALCDAGGTMPIADLAIKVGVNWDDAFQGFKDTRRRLAPKLKRIDWLLDLNQA